jgi:uncharacterized protein YndB with AHSA1/START domain
MSDYEERGSMHNYASNQKYRAHRRLFDMAISRPSLELVETTNDRITSVADFPHLSPAILFDYWTNIDLLTKWWPPAVELQPKVGGTYHFSWPKQGWHLRDKFTMLDRGKTLGFTWKWDHEKVDVTRVTLLFQPIPNGGTRLTLHHEGYAKNSEAKKTRDEHIEGWTFFLKKLQELS